MHSKDKFFVVFAQKGQKRAFLYGALNEKTLFLPQHFTGQIYESLRRRGKLPEGQNYAHGNGVGRVYREFDYISRVPFGDEAIHDTHAQTLGNHRKGSMVFDGFIFHFGVDVISAEQLDNVIIGAIGRHDEVLLLAGGERIFSPAMGCSGGSTAIMGSFRRGIHV